MTIETFYNATATFVRRTTATPTSSDTVVTVGSFAGLLRPVTVVAKLFFANNIGREFDYVTTVSAPIKVGDDMYINGTKYDVLGIPAFEDLEDGTDGYTDLRVVRK